jgi:hypothetical protein
VKKSTGTMYLIEEYGRHEETRTPDLHRVKGKLTCISNDFEGLVDRVSTSKYLQGGPITGVDRGCEILGTFGAACKLPKKKWWPEAGSVSLAANGIYNL